MAIEWTVTELESRKNIKKWTSLPFAYSFRWYFSPLSFIMGVMDKKKLLLIDGSSVAFRAFFALYQQLDRFKNANGLHTNAIYGFQLMLNHVLERVEPSHVLVAFDAGKTTFRTEMYADYKGGRAKTPDEFS